MTFSWCVPKTLYPQNTSPNSRRRGQAWRCHSIWRRVSAWSWAIRSRYRRASFAGSVVASVLTESLLLCLFGAAFGALIAYALFNGEAISTVGGVMSDAQLVYELRVTPTLIALGTVVALTVGLIGALFPSIRAARVLR
jgi:hypothetical protein